MEKFLEKDAAKEINFQLKSRKSRNVPRNTVRC